MKAPASLDPSCSDYHLDNYLMKKSCKYTYKNLHLLIFAKPSLTASLWKGAQRIYVEIDCFLLSFC